MNQIFVKNIKQFYALVICLITIIIVLVSLVCLTNSFISIRFPEYRVQGSLKVFESDSDYYYSLQNEFLNNKSTLKNLENMSIQDLRKKRLFERNRQINDVIHEGYSSFITSLQWLVFSTLFFIFHWIIFKKTENS